MQELAEEALNLVNNGTFRVTDPGPLYAPVRNLTVRRDEKLRLIVETEAPSSAKSNAVDHAAGTIRLATERATLVNLDGTEAELEGLIGSSVNINYADAGGGLLREKVRAHRLTVKPGDTTAVAYTIDWLENLPRTSFLWPDLYKSKEHVTVTRTFGRSEKITKSGTDEHFNFANSAAELRVDGRTFYVCALDERRSEGRIHPGCIVYLGAPDEALRKRIRTALSFALGAYLVDLGTTLYDDAWTILVAVARDAYSLGMRAFDLHPSPLAPVGPANQYHHQITEAGLERAIRAFVAAYDDFDLSNLSWAYWHARTATTHIAPVQFGAAIEALQRRYIKKHRDIIDTIISASDWKQLHGKISALIEESGAPDDAKEVLTDKVKRLNKLDQRPLLKVVLTALNLRLSNEEDDAWSRRNKSAHGMPVREGQSLAAIRDMHLLRGIFHRMLLRMTDAADMYVDYASEKFPHRPLEMPPAELRKPGQLSAAPG